MRLKSLCRIGGIVDVSAAGYFGYLVHYILANQDYKRIVEVLSGDSSIEHKTAAAAVLGIDSLLAASFIPLSIMAADGVVDIYKGTHHYLGACIWKRITRNPKTKEWIQKGIDEMVSNSKN